jgi:hypothetical protein
MGLNEASSAHGEMYDITGSNTITTTTKDLPYPIVTATPGIIGARGLVRFDTQDREGWLVTDRYSYGQMVAHSSKNWLCKAAGYTAWAAATTYTIGQTCSYGGHDWTALGTTKGNIPEVGSAYWVDATIGQEPGVVATFWTDSGLRGDCLVIQPGGAGTYRVSARVFFTGTAASVFTWQIFKNTVAQAKLKSLVTAVSGVEHTAIVQGLLELADGDVVDLRVAASVGGETVTILGASLDIVRIYEN